MSYFSSLASHKATQDAVAQHTQDAEDAVKDAKAQASQKAYEGYSQLLETAGGSTTGLAGGFHLTRKIYKKYQAKKQATQDEKAQGEKDTQDAKDQDAQDDKDADDELGEPEDFEEGSTAETKTSTSTAGDVDDGVAQAKNTGAEDLTKEGDEADDKEADDELGEPEDYDLKTTGTPDDVKGSDTSASQSEAPETTGGEEANTQGADTIEDLKPSTTQPSVMADDNLDSGFRISSSNAQDLDQGNTDMLTKAQGGQDQTQDTEGQSRNPNNLGEEPDPLQGEDKDAGTTPDDSELPDPVDYDIKSTDNLPKSEVSATDQSAVKAGGDSTGAEIAGDTEESADRIEQGASAFSKITPTPSGGVGGLGLDASADATDIATAGSSLLDSGLEIASTALDFLGPVGEIAGAGIALGGFFHSLFDGGEKKKEEADEDADTDMSQGGGISAQSLQTASQSSNSVGSTF